MSQERKSKRQERRTKIAQQERRNRLVMIGLVILGAVLLVFAVVWPQLRPIAEVVAVDTGTYPDAKDNSMGDPNAPIKIEEFADFQCPFCDRFHKETEPLLKQYYIDTGKVHFAFRSMGNFVSDNIAKAQGTQATTESQDAALAAYCAGDQNKFWEMHAYLFANALGEDAGSFTDKRLAAIAEKAGLNTDQFNSCYSSGKFRDRVQQDAQDGQAANVTGTPGFIITYTVNGETKTDRIDGAEPFSTFQQKLETALHEIGTK
ncbi:MAG TPA: thioredoxin domain-containing protein [Anaerolineales bacterium]|nr:thioredoxin domain-containing protein [Anaerolineales bacterium]